MKCSMYSLMNSKSKMLNKLRAYTARVSLANVLTREDSPLSQALQLWLFTERLNICIEDVAETKSTEKQLG